MKSKLSLLALGIILLQCAGCVAIPPLINVHESNNGSKSRIESMERRLDRLEEKVNKLDATPKP